MSLIINFFGGPGIGKSSQASELFSLMKKNHMDVENTYEFPKYIAWEENMSAIKDQFYVSANQHRNISRLHNKVKYIIVDSPIISGLIYKELYDKETNYPSCFYDETFDMFLMNLFKRYNSLNIVLKRNDSQYQQKGRFQNLDEAKKIDDMMLKTLEKNNIPYIEFQVNENTSVDIFNYIKQNLL